MEEENQEDVKYKLIINFRAKYLMLRILGILIMMKIKTMVKLSNISVNFLKNTTLFQNKKYYILAISKKNIKKSFFKNPNTAKPILKF